MTKEQLDVLLEYIRRGVDLDVAANVVSVSLPIIFAILERGKVEEERRYTEGKGRPTKEAEFAYGFYTELKAAKAHAIAEIQTSIFASAKEEWRAAAWWLEKENPRKYSAQVSQEVLKNIEEGLTKGEIEP